MDRMVVHRLLPIIGIPKGVRYISAKSAGFSSYSYHCNTKTIPPTCNNYIWKRTLFSTKTTKRYGVIVVNSYSTIVKLIRQHYLTLIICTMIMSPWLIMIRTIRNGLTDNFSIINFYEQSKKASNKSLISLFLPKAALSNLSYFLATIEKPKFFVEFLKYIFVKVNGITLDDALYTDIRDYKSVQQLFTRKLQQNARKIDLNCDIISPCDGYIVNAGQIDINNKQCNELTLEYIKGQCVNLEMFIGSNEAKNLKPTSTNNNIYYTIIYLAPNNYHCFHSPTELKIESVERIKGSLYPVSPDYIRMLPGEACVNERVLIKGKWKHGFMYVIPIGAMNVGGIVVTAIKDIATTASKYWIHSKISNINIELDRAVSLGEFLLGSTIVLIFEAPKSKQFNIPHNSSILMGQSLM